MTNAVRVPISVCLGCGEANDASTPADDTSVKPGPGDIAVCLYCGHIAAYADDLTLRPLTDDEMREVAGDKELLLVQRARAKVAQELPQTFDGERGSYGDWQCSACKPDSWRN